MRCVYNSRSKRKILKVIPARIVEYYNFRIMHDNENFTQKKTSCSLIVFVEIFVIRRALVMSSFCVHPFLLVFVTVMLLSSLHL